MPSALDAIMRFESGGRNIHQNIVPPGGGYNPSTGTITGPSSAQGYFQMINPTWRRAAGWAGIDTNQYPTAMSAPYETQRQAAAALYEREGFRPWAPYNANLRAHIAQQGGPDAFYNDPVGGASGGDSGISAGGNASGLTQYTPAQQRVIDQQVADARSISAQMRNNENSDPNNPNMGGETTASDPNNPNMGGDTTASDPNNPNSIGTETPWRDPTPASGGVNSEQVIPNDPTVTAPEAGSPGNPSTLPVAVVTAANQQSQAAASAAKAAAQAALQAAQIGAKNDTSNLNTATSWASNWLTRGILFIVGAIFIAGGLFLFGGRSLTEAGSIIKKGAR